MSINPFTLLNKTIVVTGASSGIGRQCAITLNQMGAFVILLGRSEERLLETVGNFENENYQILVTDVTDYEQTAEKLEDALKTVGKVDGIVHAAGISTTLPLRNITPEKLQPFFETNVFAPIAITKLLTKLKYANPDGMSIVFLASVMGMVGELGKTTYSLTKGALVSGTKRVGERAEKEEKCN